MSHYSFHWINCWQFDTLKLFFNITLYSFTHINMYLNLYVKSILDLNVHTYLQIHAHIDRHMTRNWMPDIYRIKFVVWHRIIILCLQESNDNTSKDSTACGWTIQIWHFYNIIFFNPYRSFLSSCSTLTKYYSDLYSQKKTEIRQHLPG